ncbi:phosphotransferase [Ramlibacter solisilvae]|uniref:Aminoglycoside phosphotransferase n=1 Tax=Ramlibacter tataouinensis TaxID=94132 RepID=A0A127JTB1_9BURK|nr:phosphotransferase [Ramlibacter tataouinensis]AMO23184.1 aminoglycoside phosphotransferase [Ramlibacter tataouinensis]
MSESLNPAGAGGAPVSWNDPRRETAFGHWLAAVAPAHGLIPASVRPASADASFRRYLRIDGRQGSRIIMDAPPDKEDCRPFVKVAQLMAQAGLHVPRVLAWDEAQGFMLLDDLGTHTMIEAVDPAHADANRGLYLQALDQLLAWQLASRPGVLPPYDAALLGRELALFPDWYVTRHRGIAVEGQLREALDAVFRLIVERNLASPSVYVHRDFMPRNLMMPPTEVDVAPTLGTGVSSLPPEGAVSPWGGPAAKRGEPRLGVLDFQDAVYGPITYDIASLMRDAFLSWDEEFVLDITVRYWQKAQKAGLPVDADFGEFYRAVEWMGLQRHLKVAGIFARLTLRDGKPKYLADTPRFIGYIRQTAARYRELAPLLRVLDQVEGTDAQTAYSFGRL